MQVRNLEWEFGKLPNGSEYAAVVDGSDGTSTASDLDQVGGYYGAVSALETLCKHTLIKHELLSEYTCMSAHHCKLMF